MWKSGNLEIQKFKILEIQRAQIENCAAPNGAGGIFFWLIQALPTFWAERIWILRIYMFTTLRITNFWISRFPDFQNLDRARLGLGWARLEPSGPQNVDFLSQIFVFELATACFM